MQRNRFWSAQARSHSPVGRNTGEQTEEKVTPSDKKMSPTDLAHFAMLSRGNCWLVWKDSGADPLTGGDCFCLPGDFDCFARQPAKPSEVEFREIGAKANNNVAHCGGGGAPTTIVCGP